MNDAIIRLEGIGMMRQGKDILNDVSLAVNRGDFMAITGPNGGGKTTLLRIILKLLKPTSGWVKYYDAGAECQRLPIGYLPQKNMIDARFPISVKDVVESGLMAQAALSESETRRRVEEVLRMVELQEKAGASIGELSGGQLQRALLGRALISRPGVLVLDEPLSYLDKHFEERIYGILEEVATSTTILLVSHELSVISTMANRHLIVDRTLHECGTHHHHFVAPDCC